MSTQLFPSAELPSAGSESAQDLSSFARHWLASQCTLIGGVTHGVVVLGTPPAERYVPVAMWPPGSPPSPALISTAELALSEGRGVLSRPSGAPVRLVVPLVVEGHARGVVGLELPATAPSPRNAMRQLEWGAAGLRERLALEQLRSARSIANRADATLDSVGIALEQESFNAAAQAAVTELGVRLACERISVGFQDKEVCTVAAISQSAGFGRKVELTEALTSAMTEAIEQKASLLYPPTNIEDLPRVRAQERLARAGAGCVLTVPFLSEGACAGALVAERPHSQPFDQDTIDQLGAAAALLGPVLRAKQRNDDPIFRKVAKAFEVQQTRLLGPGFVGRKTAALLLLLALLLSLVVTAQYRVIADARIEGRVQRAVVAPFDGFIRTASSRAGDVVTPGQELATLDDRELTLERINRITERQQRQLAFDRALSERDRVESSVARAQIDEANAQIGLLDRQIERSRLVAPFKGVVVSGDLSRSIGATVRRGDVLFQVAPLDAYRIVLSVDESQIADIHVGQRGKLLTTSLPTQPFDLRIEQITPVAEPREGRTVFRVEAALQGRAEVLRPGMEGVARVEVDRRRVVWIWTRSLLDWVRIRFWAW